MILEKKKKREPNPVSKNTDRGKRPVVAYQPRGEIGQSNPFLMLEMGFCDSSAQGLSFLGVYSLWKAAFRFAVYLEALNSIQIYIDVDDMC